MNIFDFMMNREGYILLKLSLKAFRALPICSSVCFAISVALILHMPSGTEGGLTAGV